MSGYAAADFREEFDALNIPQNAPAGMTPISQHGNVNHMYAVSDPLFDTMWSLNQMTVEGGIMSLNLQECPNNSCNGATYISSQYESRKKVQYGCVSARMKAAKAAPGFVSASLFTYTNVPSWHEIDIEIYGRDAKMMMTGYFVDGQAMNFEEIPLGFDASAGFHVYQIEWAQNHIAWFVDGKEVRRDESPTRPTHPQHVMANHWGSSAAGADHFGTVAYGGPTQAQYDWIEYTEGSCTPPAEAQDNPPIVNQSKGTNNGLDGKKCYCYRTP